MLSYPLTTGRHQLFAFTRAQYYHGFVQDRPGRAQLGRSRVRARPRVEYRLVRLEITAAYTFSDRFYRDSASPDNHHSGRFLRLQAQVSF